VSDSSDYYTWLEYLACVEDVFGGDDSSWCQGEPFVHGVWKPSRMTYRQYKNVRFTHWPDLCRSPWSLDSREGSVSHVMPYFLSPPPSFHWQAWMYRRKYADKRPLCANETSALVRKKPLFVYLDPFLLTFLMFRCKSMTNTFDKRSRVNLKRNLRKGDLIKKKSFLLSLSSSKDS